MNKQDIFHTRHPGKVLALLLAAIFICGCSHVHSKLDNQQESTGRKVFVLKEITPEQARVFLLQLGMTEVSVSPRHGVVMVTASTADLLKAGVLLDLVDTKDKFVIENLAPVSRARMIPANDQIAAALGDLSIGTFADPPKPDKQGRAIIDIHGESVLAILPARIRRQVLGAAFAKSGQVREEIDQPAQAGNRTAGKSTKVQTIEAADGFDEIEMSTAAKDIVQSEEPSAETGSDLPDRYASGIKPATQRRNQPEPVAAAAIPAPEESDAAVETALAPELTVDATEKQQEMTHDPAPRIADEACEPSKADVEYKLTPLANGEDILRLDLPDRLDMIQLLDLVAEYVGLDYMFDPEKIRGQAVSLRLHGKLQGKIRVKDLYPLLESVLKFKGFAATCHKGNLVTIVPVTDVLDMDPVLLDPNNTAIGAGDMVVTRIFDLQYVDTSSATNLLQNMKLSVAASPVEEIGALIVTCYAHRMARIERLLNMIDRPGRPKEFRSRALKYTMAKTLLSKVKALVDELQTAPGTVTLKDLQPSAPVLAASVPSRLSPGPKPKELSVSEASEKNAVYLDADERTNRILMIGRADQLAIVDVVIDTLDVAQYDPRILKVYDVIHLNAADAKKKLEEFELVSQSKGAKSGAPPVFVSKTSSAGSSGATGSTDWAAADQTQVTLLEATNSLLIKATEEQHAWIDTVMLRIDMPQQDMRTLKTYQIQRLDAGEVEKMLSEFGLIEGDGEGPGESERLTESAPAQTLPGGSAGDEAETMLRPQVAVLESTNSLLINTSESQHRRMADLIEHVDVETRKEAIPYEIYFLENQDPETLAEVIGRLVQETPQATEDKIEKPAVRAEDPIIIVPDKGTFSLVVYASKRNQDWISKLITDLDKRRPQVLIDATLVEIRKTDEFNYDLNLITSFPDLVETGGQTGSFLIDETTTVADKLLQPGVRDRFVDFQTNSGSGVGFYADKHINALLTAMQTKNYGRVLANPKVLVNDNEQGSIKTADTTYIAKTSSIPVAGGGVGPQTDLIQTALDYEPYEAGITLDITPHISEGELLRLEIALTRSDFVNVTDEKPPDQTGSDVKTVVTVPDGSTIILGGMLKLNQTKGGSKVPILGDLPLVGGVFRSISNSDIQSKLYVFVRAEIIRPTEALAGSHEDLEKISKQDRAEFEKAEAEFQSHQNWPGIKPRPTDPEKVLDNN